MCKRGKYKKDSNNNCDAEDNKFGTTASAVGGTKGITAKGAAERSFRLLDQNERAQNNRQSDLNIRQKYSHTVHTVILSPKV